MASNSSVSGVLRLGSSRTASSRCFWSAPIQGPPGLAASSINLFPSIARAFTSNGGVTLAILSMRSSNSAWSRGTFSVFMPLPIWSASWSNAHRCQSRPSAVILCRRRRQAALLQVLSGLTPWCLIRASASAQSALEAFKRFRIWEAIFSLSASCPWNFALPVWSMNLAAGLPMSCNRAAQRIAASAGANFTASSVWFHTSKAWCVFCSHPIKGTSSGRHLSSSP